MLNVLTDAWGVTAVTKWSWFIVKFPGVVGPQTDMCYCFSSTNSLFLDGLLFWRAGMHLLFVYSAPFQRCRCLQLSVPSLWKRTGLATSRWTLGDFLNVFLCLLLNTIEYKVVSHWLCLKVIEAFFQFTRLACALRDFSSRRIGKLSFTVCWNQSHFWFLWFLFFCFWFFIMIINKFQAGLFFISCMTVFTYSSSLNILPIESSLLSFEDMVCSKLTDISFSASRTAVPCISAHDSFSCWLVMSET